MVRLKRIISLEIPRKRLIMHKPIPITRLLTPNCGADNAVTRCNFFLLSSFAIHFIVRIKFSGMSDPSDTGVETSLNAGCPIITGYSYGGLFSNLVTEFFVFLW